MNVMTSVEAAKAVSTNATGLSAPGRKRVNNKTWPAARVERLCAMLSAGDTVDTIAAALEVGRGAVTGQMFRMRQMGDARLPEIKRGRKASSTPRPSGGNLRRFGTIEPKADRWQLADDHPAVVEGRPLFPGRVVAAVNAPRMLVSGVNSRKIGSTVAKGPRRGWPIFTLTLPERTTCPRTCAVWNACYGNGMNWARRVKPSPLFERALRRELADLQAKYPGGYLVRLHVLGDFYSERYVDLIARSIDDFPAFHAFGFTARDPDTDEIGSAVWALAIERPDRFTFRFSGMAGPEHAARVIEHGDVDPDAIVCPAQSGGTDCCATCALCFTPSFTRSIAFRRH